MRGLTFTQPYGSAVLSMGKDVENRPIAPRCIAIGERFAVHAGKKYDEGDAWGLAEMLGTVPEKLPTGVILGTVQLVGWVRLALDMMVEGDVVIGVPRVVESLGLTDEQCAYVLASGWKAKDTACAWLLAAPRVLATPIPFKGSQGIWKVPADVEARIFAQEQESGT